MSLRTMVATDGHSRVLYCFEVIEGCNYGGPDSCFGFPHSSTGGKPCQTQTILQEAGHLQKTLT
jgi:hypothetical protein